MNPEDIRTCGELVARLKCLDRAARNGTHIVLAVSMTCWLSMTAWTGAEVLDVLVLEVDERLVEPTLTRALAKDRAGLDEALEKLSKLAPDKGVVEHTSVGIDLGDGKERVGKSDMDFGPKMPDRGTQYQKFGWSLLWEPDNQSRELKITPQATPAAAPVYAAKLVHQPDERWSLSAGMTTPKGALFIFEKIEGRDAAPAGQVWIASSVGAGGKPASRFAPKPERFFSSDTAIRASILRDSPDLDQFPSIETDLKPFCGAWKSYSESRMTFSTRMGRMKDAGKVVSMVDFRYLVDIQASTHTQYHGTFHRAIGTDKLPSHSTEPFDAITILVARNGTTTTSIPQPKEKSEEHQHHVMVFRTD